MTIRKFIILFFIFTLSGVCMGGNDSIFSSDFEAAYKSKIDLGKYSHYLEGNNLFEYANQALWYEAGKKILYPGTQYHGKPWVFLIFDYKTNTWNEHQMPNDKFDAHTYDNITIDQEKGILYWYTKKTELFRYHIETQQWEVVLQKGKNPGAKFGMALEYFPELNSLVLVFGGYVSLFNLKNNKWSTLSKGLKMGGFHNLAEYNPIDQVVMFGGGDYWNGGANDPDHHLYVLNKNKKIKAVSNAPVGVSIKQGILICDQKTGKYLYRNSDSLFRFGTFDSQWELVEQDEYGSPHKSVGISFGSSGVVAFMNKNENLITGYDVKNIPKGKFIEKLAESALPKKNVHKDIDRKKAVSKKLKGREVLSVGAERYLKTISDASRIARNKDIIEIDSGDYVNDISVWRADDLIIRGVGGNVRLMSTKNISSNGKAIMVVKGNNTMIENIEFTGAKVSDRNGAGIRLEGKNAIIKHCKFYENENGILGGGGDVTIEHSEFFNNGLGEQGKTHNLYISKGKSLTLKYSYFHNVSYGHHVKTRAEYNHILYNRITDERSSNSSYLIDIPAGGKSYVIGNILQQNADALNWTMLSYSAEKNKNKEQTLYVVSNTFANDRSNGKFIEVKSNSLGLVASNLFLGKGEVAIKDIQMQSNKFGSMKNVLDADNFDYRLKSSSIAINAGISVSNIKGVNLEPKLEYSHPMSFKDRVIDGLIDAGGFEYHP